MNEPALKATIDARVRAEQVRVIYQQAIPAQLISVVVAAIVGYVLWDVTDRRIVIIWLALVSVLAAGRITLIQSFRLWAGDAANLRGWERAFVLTLIATGMTWGVGGLMLMPADSLLHQTLVYLFLIGMAGGAVASYSAHLTSAIVTICSIMIPATAWLAVQDGEIPRALAITGIIFIAASCRATQTLSFFLQRSFQLSHELQQSQAAAELLARTDELTGIWNRRAFSEQGSSAISLAIRHRRPLSIVLLDIDHFKEINDALGHSMGDQALIVVAASIQQSSRSTDITGRLGGDEFAILLPETTGDDALRHAERVRKVVARLTTGNPGAERPLTCSIGVVELTVRHGSLEAMLKDADAALYDAKRHGRNRVVLSRGPSTRRDAVTVLRID